MEKSLWAKSKEATDSLTPKTAAREKKKQEGADMLVAEVEAQRSGKPIKKPVKKAPKKNPLMKGKINRTKPK